MSVVVQIAGGIRGPASYPSLLGMSQQLQLGTNHCLWHPHTSVHLLVADQFLTISSALATLMVLLHAGLNWFVSGDASSPDRKKEKYSKQQAAHNSMWSEL